MQGEESPDGSRVSRRGRGSRGGRVSGLSRQESSLLNQTIVSAIDQYQSPAASTSEHSRGRGKGRGRGRGRGASSSPRGRRPVGRPRKTPVSVQSVAIPEHQENSTTPPSSSTLADHHNRAIGGDGVHSITMVAQASASAATALMQRVVAGESQSQCLGQNARVSEGETATDSNTTDGNVNTTAMDASERVGEMTVPMSIEPNSSSIQHGGETSHYSGSSVSYRAQ